MIRQALKRLMEAALPRRALLVRGPAESGAVCLTFDDGPHPEHTPPLLDALDRHRAKATFFLVGKRAEAHPELVRAIVARGHAIGNHSWSHGDPERTSAHELDREASRAAGAIAAITGRAPRLFRPPHGKLTAAKLALLWRRGHSVVLWSLDPKDFAAASAAETLRYFDDHAPSAGDVILMHDTNPRAAVVVDELAARLASNGLAFTTADTWCGLPA